MLRRPEEDDDVAPPAPSFSTPTKADRNDGAGHGEPDAGGTESESDADVEKQFVESTGETRRYHPYLNHTEVKHIS